MNATIESLEIKEKLLVRYEGRSYSIETSSLEERFAGMRIALSELTEMKKLLSDFKLHLLLKSIMGAEIVGVQASDQLAFPFQT